MTLSTARSTFIVVAFASLLLFAAAFSQIVRAETIIQYDPVTIVNEAELKGAGITTAQPTHMSDEMVAELKAAPFSIINEALLKGDGIYRDRSDAPMTLVEQLKAAPFSIINEALLKGDGIYTER